MAHCCAIGTRVGPPCEGLHDFTTNFPNFVIEL
jgi:hypothetical protein